MPKRSTSSTNPHAGRRRSAKKTPRQAQPAASALPPATQPQTSRFTWVDFGRLAIAILGLAKEGLTFFNWLHRPH
jgi:hypothetical protein